MTFSAERTLRDIAVLLAGSDADGVSSSEHALETIRSAISKAKGATSVPLVTDTGLTARLLADVDLAGVKAILLAPTAAAWQADTSYTVQTVGDSANPYGGQFVHPVSPTGATFQANLRIGGTTGDTEPVWPTDGTGPADPDGDLVYTEGDAVLDAWPGAGQTLAGGALVAGGLFWATGDSGNTGLTQPDFTGKAIGDTVTDGDLTWIAYTHVTTWAALTSIAVGADELANTSTPAVRPTVPNGLMYQTKFAGVTATSGDAEPDWGAISPGDAVYVLDGDVLWQENTGSETYVVSGIPRPSGPSLLTLAFAIPSDAHVDQSVALADDVSGYAPDAAPATGDALFDTAGLVLNTSTSTPTARLFHTGTPTGRWTYLGA